MAEDPLSKQQRVGGGVDLSGGSGYTPSPLTRTTPSPQKGDMRIYRAEPTTTAEKPSWLRQAETDAGLDKVRGRWFTRREEHLGWYEKDANGPTRRIYVDATKQELEPFRAANQPRDVSRYSRDVENEYFIPREK